MSFIVRAVTRPSLSLIEFPADEPERARDFWAELLGVELQERQDSEGRAGKHAQERQRLASMPADVAQATPFRCPTSP